MRPALGGDNATEEQVNEAFNICKALMEKVEARFSDGRNYVAGSSVTLADFLLLANYSSLVVNNNLKSAALKDKIQAEFATKENYKRVVANIRQLNGMEAALAAAPQAFI